MYTVGQLKKILETLPDDAIIYGEKDIYGFRDILIEHDSWTRIKSLSDLYSDLENQKFLTLTAEAREAMLQAAKAGKEAELRKFTVNNREYWLRKDQLVDELGLSPDEADEVWRCGERDKDPDREAGT